MKKRLENALLEISVPSGLDEAAAKGIMRAKNERTGISMTRSVKVIVGVAAALAICCTTVLAAAVAGGHFEDIKDRRGAIVGQQFVDATDYFDVSLSYSQKDNQLKIEAIANENAKNSPYLLDFDSIRPAEFSLVDDSGEVVATSNEDGTIDFEFADAAFSEDGALVITMNGENGAESYRLYVNKLIGSKKAEQDLEIFGNWIADADVVFTFTEVGADLNNPEASISRVEVDDDGNVTYYNEKGEVFDPGYEVEFPTKSSSTFNGEGVDNFLGMIDITDESEMHQAVTVFAD